MSVKAEGGKITRVVVTPEWSGHKSSHTLGIKGAEDGDVELRVYRGGIASEHGVIVVRLEDLRRAVEMAKDLRDLEDEG